MIGYSLAIVSCAEIAYPSSRAIDDQVPIHLEVLLPAFILDCMMTRPAGADLHRDDAREGHQEGPESTAEQRVATIVSGSIRAIGRIEHGVGICGSGRPKRRNNNHHERAPNS